MLTVRRGAWVGVCAYFATRTFEWSLERYGGWWWTMEMIQVTAITIAFALILAKMAKLESEVSALVTRCTKIVGLVRDVQREQEAHGWQVVNSTGRKERHLRSVSDTG